MVMEAIETYFLKGLLVEGVHQFRARLLVKFCLVALLFAVGYWVDSYFTGFLAARYNMIAFIVLIAVLLVWLRHSSDQFWIAQCFMFFSWLTVVVLTLFSGGMKSFVLPWMTLIPVMGFMLLGQRSGVFWGTFGIAAVFVIYFLEGRYVISPAWLTESSDFLTLSLSVGLVGIVLSMTYVFHSQGTHLLETIQQQQEIIERHNAEMANRNETLEAEVERRTKELLDYNQQLEQFAFIASHNLRAPVASLLGLGDLLDMKQLPAADRELVSRNMTTTARELDRVVRDLSTILEMRKSSHELLSEVNLEEELNLVRVSLDRELSETDAVMEVDFTSAPLIRAVRPLLDSILVNLISNAIKYRHPDRPPRISVRSDRIGDETCLTISDNGLGMDLEAYGDKIFTLYGRFHSHVDGKGLGLYLVKTHMLAMGGRIGLESELGKGTTFRVFFKE